MISPLRSRELLEFAELPSTQTYLCELVRAGSSVGGVIVRHQTQGRGRFDRVWVSPPDSSLTVSLAFHDYPFVPGSTPAVPPHLIGMAVGLAVAGALKAQIRWPNDITLHGKKLSGILTELIPTPSGSRIAVVGIGINLTQEAFPPELAETATSLTLERGATPSARQILDLITGQIERMPDPTSWSVLDPIWRLYDATPGKRYKVGERESTALGVGSDGQLLCEIEGETHSVLAAEALFGPQ